MDNTDEQKQVFEDEECISIYNIFLIIFILQLIPKSDIKSQD